MAWLRRDLANSAGGRSSTTTSISTRLQCSQANGSEKCLLVSRVIRGSRRYSHKQRSSSLTHAIICSATADIRATGAPGGGDPSYVPIIPFSRRRQPWQPRRKRAWMTTYSLEAIAGSRTTIVNPTPPPRQHPRHPGRGPCHRRLRKLLVTMAGVNTAP